MKKKILFINGHLNVGGVERSLVDILRHLDYHKYEVDLLLLEGYGDYLPEIPQEVNVMMYPLNDAGGPLLPTLWKNLIHGHFVLFFFRLLMLWSRKSGQKVMKYARLLFRNGKKKYDVVIGYRPHNPTIFAAYIFHAKKRIAWWHHGEMNIYGKQLEDLRLTYDVMDAIVAVSNPCAQMLIDVFPNVKDKLIVIPNMLCGEEIKYKAQENDIQMSPSVFNIVSVGRMSPEKNMIFCVEVAKILYVKGILFHWYMIGDGVEFEKITGEIEKSHLSGCFTLTGRIPNPYPYVQKADLLFHPSLVESQGLTVLEGMVLGTPVMAVKSLGVKEFANDGENCMLVDAHAEDAAEIIVMLLSNVILRQHVIATGKQTAKKYAPSKVIQKIENILC